MFEESRENTGGVIAGMLRSLEDGHLDIVPSAELELSLIHISRIWVFRVGIMKKERWNDQ